MPNTKSIKNIVSGLLIIFGGIGLVACQPKEIQPPSTTVNISNPPPGNTTTKLEVHPAFQSISAKLQQQTKIPVLLPTFIPESDNPQLTALVENINAAEYKVMLAFAPQCNGGAACYLGSVSGKLVDGNLVPEGTKVALANKLTGYFVDASCGANCADATLSWIEEGNLYQVAIKGGQLATLLEMANSMTKQSLNPQQ
jgi:hypothetical protein